MRRTARIFSATAIAVASVFVGVTAPAGASAARTVVMHRGASAAAVPNSNLSGKGAKAKFTPAKLTAPVYKNKKACAGANPPVSLTLTNATKNAYDIGFNGSAIGTLPKNTIGSLCIYGKPGTGEFEIAGSTHVLTVKFVKATA